MFFAYDYNDNRVHIDDTHSNQEYFCYCGEPVIVKKGDIRKHHFAHKKGCFCLDNWDKKGYYNTTQWHSDWQDMFPEENQEVIIKLGNTKHRADVMVDRSVIEFQKSSIPEKAFEDRNNFYLNLGYKIIWLIDLSNLFEDGKIIFEENNNELNFKWKNPKKAFNRWDIEDGKIELFFQLKDSDNDCIIQVLRVSEYGFEEFYSTKLMSKNDFLEYVGLKNGFCLPPFKDYFEENKKYSEFKEKYKIKLNKDQERAVLAVKGANLLLATPGSGKTTVLITRLGHMIINKNIPPENILAIAYNKDIAIEMKKRFSCIFGKEIGDKIEFRTINAFSNRIYVDYCNKNGKTIKRIIDERSHKSLIGEKYREYTGEYATENEINEIRTAITYIKNLILNREQIKNIGYPYLNEIYKDYQDSLEKSGQMDFDDQMLFAYDILQNDEKYLNNLRNKYKYICVDEAQDTSKIQHEIIKILAKNNNIFMVGDEDQSIYGFRGAYPRALMNFKFAYKNSYLLFMESNYRSTPQIVDLAKKFIKKNPGRYNKDMKSLREEGNKVELLEVQFREEQYFKLVDIAQKAQTETAFLYRDNESAVVLVDLLLRNNIPFKLKKPEQNFFNNRIVKDINAYISLSLDEYDTEAFNQIVNKGILYLKKTQKYFAAKNCKEKDISIFDAVDEQMQYVKKENRSRAFDFRDKLNKISKATSSEQAISIILNEGYNTYLEETNCDRSKIEILLILAKQEANIKKFLERLKELENILNEGVDYPSKNKIILSTIHSSKGLEYDSVYMIDVYDGRFPASRPNIFSISKDDPNGEKEERRLFYVGVTRAKNELHLFSIRDRISTFIEDIFPEQKIKREIEERKEEERKRQEESEERYRRQLEERTKWEDEEKRRQELEERELEERRKQEKEKRYNEVKDKFNQQEEQIMDSAGVRWIQCKICGKIDEATYFCSYGGSNQINLGRCNECDKESRKS